MNFDRFVDNYNKIKDLQSSLFESFIKLTKHLKEYSSSNLLDNHKIYNRLLFDQNIKEKDKDNDMNNLRIEKSETLSSDKIDFSLIFFFKKELKFFRSLTKFFKNYNLNIIDYKTIYEKKNKELKEKISILKLDLEKEKEIKNELNLKIKELEILIKDKEKEISEEKLQINDLINKINDIKNTSNSNKIIELLEKKDNEINELKKILLFEYTKEDKIFTVNFLSSNEDIYYSMICKNTDKFYRLEDTFYHKFPEYKKDGNNFSIPGKTFDRFNSLESNNINDNDIIIFKT